MAKLDARNDSERHAAPRHRGSSRISAEQMDAVRRMQAYWIGRVERNSAEAASALGAERNATAPADASHAG